MLAVPTHAPLTPDLHACAVPAKRQVPPAPRHHRHSGSRNGGRCRRRRRRLLARLRSRRPRHGRECGTSTPAGRAGVSCMHGHHTFHCPAPRGRRLCGVRGRGRAAADARPREHGSLPGARTSRASARPGPARHVACVPHRCTARRPRQAGGLPETFLTAYQLLHFVGQTRPGDVVLVHAAASGVGIAAIQLARSAGARVVATAGSDDKLALARRCARAGTPHLPPPPPSAQPARSIEAWAPSWP